MWKIETWTSRIVEEILNLGTPSESREFKRGYLAGIFDSEGSYSADVIRIANKDEDVLSKIEKFGKEFGFVFKREHYKSSRVSTLRLEGDIGEKIRFFSTTNPSISRKKLTVLGHSHFLHPAEILAIERMESMEVWDLTTTTHTFFADGFASHNCWARLPIWRHRLRNPHPIKEANRLARARKTRSIVISFTDDPYQPREWKEGLTRRVLEILLLQSKVKHAIMILTKNPKFALDRDYLLLRGRNVWLGTALTAMHKIKDEPNAPSNLQRALALDLAHSAGLRTWVSIEPWLRSVTIPEKIIKKTYKFVDFYVIGRHNYEYAGNYPKVPDRFYTERLPKIIRLLKDLKKPFFIKKELRRCLGGI